MPPILIAIAAIAVVIIGRWNKTATNGGESSEHAKRQTDVGDGGNRTRGDCSGEPSAPDQDTSRVTPESDLATNNPPTNVTPSPPQNGEQS